MVELRFQLTDLSQPWGTSSEFSSARHGDNVDFRQDDPSDSRANIVAFLKKDPSTSHREDVLSQHTEEECSF